MTTDDGFSLKSGFRKISWQQTMVLVLNQVSQKYHVHQTFLYSEVQWVQVIELRSLVFQAGTAENVSLS